MEEMYIRDFFLSSDSEGFQPLRLLKDVSPGSDAFFPSRGSFTAASETSSAAGVHKLRLERHPALLNMIRAPTHKLNAHD